MTFRTLITFSLFLATLTSVPAAKYIHPDETKELFKVEKIPLQVDSMKELSRHLTILARRDQDKSPVQRRGTGQLLALAMRLDPANQDARATDRAMRSNASIDTPAKDRIVRAKARLRFFQRWLANPEAGNDANALAQYITDATRVLKEDTLNNADTAEWTGVLPPLAKYESTVKIDKKPPPKPPIQTPKETPKATPAKLPNPYKIAELKVNMPLAMETVTKYIDANDGNKEKWRRSYGYAICPVQITLTPENKPISFQVKSQLGLNNNEQDAGGLKVALNTLKKRMGSSPANGGAKAALKITSKAQYSAKNGSAGAAAVALMLEASRAGKELRNDVHLIAALDKEGNLVLPPNFWQVLGLLREDNVKRGRLIVPRSATAALTQILVFDEPDFFIRWEVFTVGNIEQAVAFAAKDSEPKVTEAADLFLSVRNLAKKSAVTKISVNSAVRKRMSEVEALAPNHLSASALLLQGSGKRPMRLSKLGLAYQLQPIVSDMRSSLAKISLDYPQATPLKVLHESSRKKLDPLERIVSSSEDVLYEKAVELANDARSLYSLLKRNARYNSSTNTSKARAMILSLQKDSTKLEAAIKLTINPAAASK